MIEKTYEGFLNIFNNHKQKIKNTCEEYGIKNYIINDDLSIHVNGSVYLTDMGLTKLPLNFNKVSGDFWCNDNQLTSLEGAPLKISTLLCENNIIYTFDNAPMYINGVFRCNGNPIFEIWNLFRDYDKIEFFNDCDPIRKVNGKPAIILERLNEFLEGIGKEPVEKIEGYINL